MSPVDHIAVSPESDGVVRIGDPPIAATYVSEVGLPGITFLVDPSDPDPAMHALVDDAEVCRNTVEAMFGAEVADAVSVGTAASVALDPSEELRDVEHVGRLGWLDQFRPVPLDFDLLELESVVARAQFPEDEPGLDDPGRVARLVEVARRVREFPDLPLARELQDLYRASLPFLPAADDDFPGVAHERELLLVQDAWGGAALSRGDLEWLAQQITPASAVRLGNRSDLGGSASIDWRRVPRALLPATEGTVRFTVSGQVVDVVVDGPGHASRHPAVPQTARDLPELVASLRSSEWPLPLAEGELVRDTDTGQWRASLSIVPRAVELARAAAILDVDVRVALLPWAAPNQRRSRAQAARRWAARGIAARRLAAVAGDQELDQAGSGSLRFAARYWDAIERRDRAERCRTMAAQVVVGTPLSIAETWLLSSEGGRASWVRPAGD